jgi:hypothetical protein
MKAIVLTLALAAGAAATSCVSANPRNTSLCKDGAACRGHCSRGRALRRRGVHQTTLMPPRPPTLALPLLAGACRAAPSAPTGSFRRS